MAGLPPGSFGFSLNDQSVSSELRGFKFLRRRRGGYEGGEVCTPRACRGLGRRPGAPRTSTAPRAAADGHRRRRVPGRKGHVILAESPRASGVFRHSLKIPQTQTWRSAGSLCAAEHPRQATPPPAPGVAPNLGARDARRCASVGQKVHETQAPACPEVHACPHSVRPRPRCAHLR